MRGALVLIGLITFVSACSGQAGDALNTMNVDETLTTENIVGVDDYIPPAPPVPTHLYDFHEGEIYGYIAAISEEEKKNGKAAGDVVMFRYLGFYDDADHLERVNAAGNKIGSSECARPCVAIKTNYSGQLDRTAFNPASIVGAAFVDAQNGKLTAAPRPRVSTDKPQSEFAGEQSAAVNQPDRGSNWTIEYTVENGQ
jgi:hypothetical protein